MTEINLARIKRNNRNYEVVVDPVQALSYREGKEIEIRQVVKVEEIFADAKKGLVAPEKHFQDDFQTTNKEEVISIIIKKGDLQVTSEQRSKMRDEKKRKIVTLIHRNAIDPKTDLPHPETRIEAAMLEAKVRIDENKRAEDQIKEIVSALRPILPIKFEIREYQLKIPSLYAAKAYQKVKQNSKVLNEIWANDGSWLVTVEIPAGLTNEFFDSINDLTKGETETKLLRKQ